MGDDVSGMRDDKETEREDDMRREEEENCCLSCRDNIPPKSNSAHKSCGTFFFFSPATCPPPPLSFQSDSCLGNHGKSSFSQTDVPFSWKLECVKNPRDANYFKVRWWRERDEGWGGVGGRRKEQKDNGRKEGRAPPSPPLFSSDLSFFPSVFCTSACES